MHLINRKKKWQWKLKCFFFNQKCTNPGLVSQVLSPHLLPPWKQLKYTLEQASPPANPQSAPLYKSSIHYKFALGKQISKTLNMANVPPSVQCSDQLSFQSELDKTAI